MKRFVWMLVAIMAVCVCLPCRGASDDEELEEVHKTINAETIKKIMGKEGFAVTVISKNTIMWKLDGYKNYIIISKDNKSVSFAVSFSSKETTLEEVNQFNKKYRYGKAYMPQTGTVKMEADFNFNGGVTEANFIHFCNIYKDLFQKWRQTVL